MQNEENQNRPFIHLETIRKSFIEGQAYRQVLNGASLSLHEGEITAILGKSGSGKSTLLNLISGIDYPDSGKIFLKGNELSSFSDYRRTLFRRKYIGFIFQFFNLIPTLTVWENLILPLELNDRFTAESKENAKNLLEEVGLGDRKSAFPDRLSGGEQQRVTIARALVHDPLLVLADEPTGNLDADMGRQILDLLNRLTRKAGKSLILVTHSNEAASYADRIITLKSGQLISSEQSL